MTNKMKKLLLISMLAGAMPLALMAQDDDLYFVPKKKAVVEVSQDRYGMPKDTYYSGSDRSVDEYNRRMKSRVEVLDGDSTKSDIISFDGEKGVYPDSVLKDDYKYTKRMSRFDDYRLADNAAFWAGYQAGRYDWGWHSPWYYNTIGWYGSWYDPWYDPWYYSRWYDPWYYGYAGWYSPWYYSSGWYWGWRPYYYYPRYVVIGGGGRRQSSYIGTGTLRRDGTTYSYRGSLRGSVTGNSSRMSSMRDRARQMGGSRTYSSGNSQRSSSGNFSGYRGSSRNSGYSGGGSFGGSRSGGGGSFGGSRGGGGGGGRSGGGGLGGRR